MTARAVAIFVGRIKPEEGERLLPYDDKTGKSVAAPVGKLSWGHGYNLMQCGSAGLFAVMDVYLATLMDSQLSRYPWYLNLDTEPTRQSVFLDVGYNEGLGGLLHFPHMIAYAAAGKWTDCAAECTVEGTDPNLDASRYAPLRKLLLNGDIAP